MKHRVKCDSGSAPVRASRPRRLVPRVGGLAGRTKAPARGTDKEKPPRRNPGGQKESNRWASAFDRVAALPALALGGRDRQPHLLAQGARQEPADRVRLPAGGFPEFRPCSAAGASQQVEDLGGFAALAGTSCLLLGRLGRRRAFVGLLGRGGLLARPGLGQRNVGPVCRGPRHWGGPWLLGRGTGLGVGGFCWNAVHTSFSLGGDYRAITWITRVGPNCKLIPMRIPHGRRSGDGGELGPRWGQIGADSGRWGLFAKFGRK